MFSPLKKQMTQFSNPVKNPISNMSDEEFQQALDKVTDKSLQEQMLRLRSQHLQEIGAELNQQSVMLQAYNNSPSPSAQ
jgi:hypothetical protein